ncbi:MAG TPA: PAS domain S-box protein, partial [Methanocella sp.]|nr:PAS domain S-box protein [Methanocella sp.]
MERKLAESEEKYRMITTSTGDGIITTDLNGFITYVNPSSEKMVGMPASDILGRHFIDFIADEYKDRAAREFSRSIAGEAISPFEVEALDVNEKRIPLEVSASALEVGVVKKGVIVTFRDVRERWKAREELKKAHEELERRVEERTRELAQARQMLQTTLDTIPAAVLVTDVAGLRVTYANRSALRMLGENIQGLSLWSAEKQYEMLWPDGSKPELEDLPLSRSMRMGEHIFDVEMLVRREDGSDISVLFSSAPILGPGGDIVGAVASSIDITERKQMERALGESEEKFRVLAETTTSAIFIYQGGRFSYVNSATSLITGYSKEELLSMNFWDWVHPDYREMVRRNGRARRQGRPAPMRYEIKFMTRGGEERWAEITPGLIGYHKEPANIVTVVDITDRKRTEEALKGAKENAEMYLDLMGHDINNMNQVALGYIEMALDSLPPDGPVPTYLSRSYAMLRDSSSLIDNLRKVQQAMDGMLRLETVDLGSILSEVAAEYALVPGRDVMIVYRYEKCPVRANP